MKALEGWNLVCFSPCSLATGQDPRSSSQPCRHVEYNSSSAGLAAVSRTLRPACCSVQSPAPRPPCCVRRSGRHRAPCPPGKAACLTTLPWSPSCPVPCCSGSGPLRRPPSALLSWGPQDSALILGLSLLCSKVFPSWARPGSWVSLWPRHCPKPQTHTHASRACVSLTGTASGIPGLRAQPASLRAFLI